MQLAWMNDNNATLSNQPYFADVIATLCITPQQYKTLDPNTKIELYVPLYDNQWQSAGVSKFCLFAPPRDCHRVVYLSPSIAREQILNLESVTAFAVLVLPVSDIDLHLLCETGHAHYDQRITEQKLMQGCHFVPKRVARSA